MLSKIKPQLEPLKIIIAKPFIKIHPNVLSVIGMLFALVFFFALMKNAYIIAALALAGTGFDMIDGTVARLRGKESPFGEVLDSTLDRISDAIIIIAFGYAGLVRWEIVSLLLLFSLLTSYVRHRGEEAIILSTKEMKGYKLDIGTIERPERILIIACTVLLEQFFPNNTLAGLTIPEVVCIVLAFLSFVTVIQRIAAIYSRLNRNH